MHKNNQSIAGARSRSNAGLAFGLCVAVTLATPSVRGLAAETMGQEGHGGRVRFCSDENGVVTPEVLEYQVAASFGNPVDLGEGPSVQNYVNTTMDRLARIDPARAETWRKRALDFDLYAMSQPDTSIDQFKIDDKDYKDPIWYLLPNNCTEVALVMQLLPEQQTGFFKGKKYLVDSRLKDQPARVQAGIRIHEAIYEDWLAANPGRRAFVDPVLVINALVSSAKISDLSPSDWNSLLTSQLATQSASVDIDGQPVALHHVSFFPKGGQIAYGAVSKPFSLEIRNAQDEKAATVENWVRFALDGSIRAVWTQDTRVQLRGAQNVHLSTLLLTPEREVVGGTLSVPATLTTAEGSREFKKGDFVLVDEAGLVVTGGLFSVESQTWLKFDVARKWVTMSQCDLFKPTQCQVLNKVKIGKLKKEEFLPESHTRWSLSLRSLESGALAVIAMVGGQIGFWTGVGIFIGTGGTAVVPAAILILSSVGAGVAGAGTGLALTNSDHYLSTNAAHRHAIRELGRGQNFLVQEDIGEIAKRLDPNP